LRATEFRGQHTTGAETYTCAEFSWLPCDERIASPLFLRDPAGSRPPEGCNSSLLRTIGACRFQPLQGFSVPIESKWLRRTRQDFRHSPISRASSSEANRSAGRYVCRTNGERAGTRTQDLLINLPPRLSPPPLRGLWSGPSLHLIPLAGRRRVPSGLYTFPWNGAWLGIAVAATRTGSPTLTPSRSRVSPWRLQIEVSCSTD